MEKEIFELIKSNKSIQDCLSNEDLSRIEAIFDLDVSSEDKKLLLEDVLCGNANENN